MNQYLLLLRGVNVGGKNKISMEVLKQVLQQNGFTSVRSYINSGNLLCESAHNQQTVRELCEKLILESFAKRISVCVLERQEFCDAVDSKPLWWGCDDITPQGTTRQDTPSPRKHNAVFCLEGTAQEFLASVTCLQEGEQIEAEQQILFWSVDAQFFDNSALKQQLDKKRVSQCVTVRNYKTTLQLRALMAQK
ncbi:MAG: DUF1697 domain-containing protein [Firmicutes bacterium]|nr:DUF1697 domain-containing protein [Bacillota bacterium]